MGERVKHLDWLFIGLCGLFMGEAAYRGFDQSRAAELPSGWQREQKRIPYQLAALQGDSEPVQGAIKLDFYRAIYPLEYRDESLGVTIHLPPQGQLEVWANSPPLMRQLGGRWIDECQHRENRKSSRCVGARQYGVGLIIDSIDEGSISLVRADRSNRGELKCTPSLSADLTEPIQVEIKPSAQRVEVSINGIASSCSGPGRGISKTAPMLRPGLREVQITDLRLGAQAVGLPAVPNRFLCWLLCALAALGCSLVERKTGAGRRGLLLTNTVFLLSVPLFWADIRAWGEALRAAWLPEPWLGVLIPLVCGLALKLALLTTRFAQQVERHSSLKWGGILLSSLLLSLLTWVAGMGPAALAFIPLQIGISWIALRLGLPLNAALGIALWALLGAALMSFLSPTHWSAIFWSAIVLQSGISIVLINRFANRVSAFNWLSLALSTLCLIAFETMLRGTIAGQQWSSLGSTTQQNDMFGWVRQANQDFEEFEAGVHTTYPTSGYPIAISNRQGRKAVVAMGGSTTGGAYQNDNLRDFYPAKLEQLLGDKWSVLNQGVGGWTTWHIERYLAVKKSELNPSAITLYIGHNDLLTATPLPYRQLFSAWESNKGRKQIGQSLQQYRSYNALRSILVALRPAETRVAVPVEHAKENLLSIAKNYPGVPLIVASEGLSPDPGPLAGYNKMMEQLAAQSSQITYVPIAEKLHRFPSSDIYLDDCHLTQLGHRKVAEYFAQPILELE